MQSALDYAMPLVQNSIERFRPRMLMVHSKGVSIACELARLEIWRRHILISSPIINPSDALAEDDYTSMGAILNGSSGVNFAMGIDEVDLIMEEAGMREV